MVPYNGVTRSENLPEGMVPYGHGQVPAGGRVVSAGVVPAQNHESQKVVVDEPDAN